VAGDLGAARRRARDELAGLRSSVAELLGL
jgi:hypothetical protein